MSKTWRKLFKLLGTQLRFSSAYHPQIDGQTERINQGIEEYVRSYVNADQKDWADYIDVLEFYYNSAAHSATGYSPFELSTGKEVITPLALVANNVHAKDYKCVEFLQQWQERMQKARVNL